MEKIISNIKRNWILYLIILQPILDIVSFFETKIIGVSHTWIVRILTIIGVFSVTYLKSKNRKKLILYLLPFALYFIIHMLNLYRINELNILLDLRYFILVFQLPVLTILLIDYIKNTNYDLEKIKKGIFINFIIITISVILSCITKTNETTYFGMGLIGWFSSANTQSMILSAMAPWVLYYLSNSKKVIVYIGGCILIFIMLYINATRACYITLLGSLCVMLISFIFAKNENKKTLKIIVTFLFIFISVFSYKYSFSFNRRTELSYVTEEYAEDIKTIIEKEPIESIDVEQQEIQEVDYNNINNYDDEVLADILRTSYIYENIMEIQGEQAVVDAMRPYLSPSALADNRLVKIINAKIEYMQSDLVTKFLGIGYSRIQENQLDLENDLHAIYYYYGYAGLLIYISFILYFVIKLAILFFKKMSIIRDKEYVILAFLIVLLIVGGEYSGAFLRKSNANIYLTLYLILLHFKLEKDFKKKVINSKKISFLLLHLGYGGVESATINTANALSEKYDVELISFYKLKENQTKYLKKGITIKYLYNGGPNRVEFKQALKSKNLVNILKQGFKAVNILVKKRYLIKSEIVNSNSFAIISTRSGFSKILNKFGRNDIIKIAQEHHHHNDNKKYINILKNKYRKIDYLFALTNDLKKDYEKFLKNNKHTKIVLVPNMLDSNRKECSDLSKTNIITISRLDEGKRINELIDIFSKIENDNVRLYIIGSGDEKENLEKQINNMGLNNKIVMTGYLNKEEQLKYILKSSVYAMTSISEALPMVLLEVMQFGIPCIAYKTDSGVSDIIKNNQNGFVIQKREQEKYIEKLNLLLKNEELRKSMSANCMKTSEKYKKESIIKIWFSILKQ